MPEFTIVDDDTGMEITLDGAQAPTPDEFPELFGQARKQSAQALSSGEFKLGADLQHLDKVGERENIRKHSARAMGISPQDIDIDTGASFKERTVLSMLPDPASQLEHMEKKYGADNVEMLDIGGKPKMFYRDPKTSKMVMVDEQGASLADFTADIAGAVLPTAGAIGGAIKGAALGTAVAPGIGTLAGGVLGAAAGGFGAGVTQDIAAEVATGQELEIGEKLERRGKEAVIGAGLDVALLGLGKLAARPFLSRMTGDASARAFSEAGELLPEGALTPRMMQGTEGLTRELGMEPRLGGRVGDARKAIDAKAREIVAQSDPAAYDRFATKIAKERDTLLESIPAGEKALAERVTAQYNETLQGFGAGEGRTLGEIGQDIIDNSTAPALKESRRVKNELYGQFNAIDQEIGGVFQPKDLVARFDDVLQRNRMKSNSAIKALRKEISGSREPFTIGEVDDLIARVTDAMPEGVVKDKTAQQLAAELSDSLSSLVRKKARQFPELERAWGDANQYYKQTFLRFNRGGVGGITRETSGDAVLSPQSFMRNVLSDAREVRNVLETAKQGGQSPSVVKARLKEAFLETKGIRKGNSIKNLTVSPSERDVVKELWGSRGLKRLQALERGLKATPEQLDDYLGALSDVRATEARKEIMRRSEDIKRLENIQKNAFMRELADGNMPSGQDSAIAKAFMGMKKSKRMEALKAMEETPGSKEHLRGIVGSKAIYDGVDTSPFRDSMGENLFNGTAALNRLNNNKDAIIDAVGRTEYDQLKKLAIAQNKLKPISREEASAKLRTLAGGGGISFYIVGDIISNMRDKFIALAYRTKALDPLMSGWHSLDIKTLNKALRAMLYGAQSKKAITDFDDPEFEQQVDLLRTAIPE